MRQPLYLASNGLLYANLQVRIYRPPNAAEGKAKGYVYHSELSQGLGIAVRNELELRTLVGLVRLVLETWREEHAAEIEDVKTRAREQIKAGAK